MDERQAGELLERARRAKENAYAPYSKFKVGAAVLAEGGRVFTGVNVENSAYGETLCAERVAIGKAVSEGARELMALAVIGDERVRITPCGSCRQVINEFNPDCVVVTAVPGEPTLMQRTAADLLPDPFLLPEEGSGTR